MKSSKLNVELDTLHLNTWRAFITLHATLIDQIDRDLIAAEGLPLHWYDVLVELVEAPDHRLRMNELARKVVLSRSGLTRLVDRLESAELLSRQPDPSDRRGSYAVLTEKGRAALRQSWPLYAKGIQTYFARHLSDADAEQLHTLLSRLLAEQQSGD